MLELAVVLVLLGILTAGAASILSTGGTLPIERDRLASRLVYTRAQAMQAGGGACLRLEKTTVALSLLSNGEEKPLSMPGEESSSSLASGVSGSPKTACFDALGRVCPLADMTAGPGDILACPQDAAAAAIRFSLAEGDETSSLDLYPATGLTVIP